MQQSSKRMFLKAEQKFREEAERQRKEDNKVIKAIVMTLKKGDDPKIEDRKHFA